MRAPRRCWALTDYAPIGCRTCTKTGTTRTRRVADRRPPGLDARVSRGFASTRTEITGLRDPTRGFESPSRHAASALLARAYLLLRPTPPLVSRRPVNGESDWAVPARWPGLERLRAD